MQQKTSIFCITISIIIEKTLQQKKLTKYKNYRINKLYRKSEKQQQ